MNKLPIYNILDTLLSQLKISKNIIIEAATGAGKTTRIPLALLNANWLLDKKIIMLEPRRLAARAAANHMANILGERVGETVGYHIRMDRKIGKNTIIQVVTEGILTKILQDDPALEDIGAIIFDEFHERSLNADLALALSIDCQIGLRPDLRLLVMSATLNGAMVAKILDDAPIITSKGRSHAVEVKYFPKPMANKLCQETVAAIELALRQEKGSILTFLPGEGEIKQVERLLRSNITRQQNNDNIIIAPLYGMMATKAQDLALKPAAIGMRKVVLTTAIAETSLTIDGIRVVIDAGLSRVAKFNMANGMTKLETISVAKSAADQRSGRAGRLQSGVCYRLWSKAAHVGLKDYPDPEILNADLASLALNLALWGVKSPNDLKWLTPPPQVRYDKAVLLLKNMAAIGQDGLITNHGKKMAKISIHPRLAHMILKAKSNGHGYLACLIAALLTEGDFINLKGDQGDIDISLRLELMINPHHASKYGDGLRKSILMRAIKAAKSWCQNLDIDSNFKNNNKLNFQMAGVVLALAYPDHIAKSRDAMGGRYLLTNGSGAMVNPLDKLANNQYLVAANIGGHGVDSKIFLAAEITINQIRSVFNSNIIISDEIKWDKKTGAIIARRKEKIWSLILSSKPILKADNQTMVAALIDAIKDRGIDILPWNKGAVNLRQRLAFLYDYYENNGDDNHDNIWPDMSDDGLLANIDDWLAPYLSGFNKIDDLSKLNLVNILKNNIDWQQQKTLDKLAPSQIKIASGSMINIDYSYIEKPVMAVKLQEMFGNISSPSIMNGNLPLLLHLLSPSGKTLQITSNLASFWDNGYGHVKSEMKGRYPKHPWPDDPINAMPTNKTKAYNNRNQNS